MAVIHYARTDEFWRRGQKYDFLDANRDVTGVAWQIIQPDARHIWLMEGMEAEFDTFLPLGTQEAKAGEGDAIFEIYSNGVKTNRDNWAYNFGRKDLSRNIQKLLQTYNEHVANWKILTKKVPVNNFISNDSRQISWSSTLKENMKRGTIADFTHENLRQVLYRPFTKTFLYFAKPIVDRPGQFPKILPLPICEHENLVICIGGYGRKSFSLLATNLVPDLNEGCA